MNRREREREPPEIKMAYIDGLVHKVNEAFARSSVGRLFRLEGSGHVSSQPPEKVQTHALTALTRQEKALPNARFSTEIRAGLTTFFTMAYIISVNAVILKDSGGTCVCTDAADITCVKDAAYNECLLRVYNSADLSPVLPVV